MESQRGVEIKVGILVIVALGVAGVLIFMIGSATQMFDKQVNVFTTFRTVSGLKVGSPVHLSGLKVGVVDEIRIGEIKTPTEAQQPESSPQKTPASLLPGASTKKKPPQVSGPMIVVRMKLVEKMLSYIRIKDSVASIQGKGLLGDSLIEISMGTQGSAVQADGYIRGETPRSLNDLIGEGGEIVASLKRSLTSVEDILKQYQDPTLSNNVKTIVSSFAGIFRQVKEGPGLLHDLIYPSRLVRNVQGIVAQVNGMTTQLNRTVGQVNSLMYRAQKPGTFVHTLLLARDSGKLVQDLEKTLDAAKVAVSGLAQILQAPQRKGTLLHTILYTKETSRMIANVVQSTDYLRTIMRDIRRGKGSLGALINDPTAFEDFKTILGQVKRSRIFKALIRFIIKRDDSSKGGQIVRTVNVNR